MCAQQNDDVLEFLRLLYIKNNKLWADYRVKRISIEKMYLEKNLHEHKNSIEKESELLHSIYKTIKEFEKYLAQKQFEEVMRIINTLSSGQKKYLGLLLKSYEQEPRSLTTSEIIKKNNLPRRRRSTIQRLLNPPVPGLSKWTRGHDIIKKLLETTYDLNDRKKRVHYRPKGILATFSHTLHYCKTALTHIDENLNIFLVNYNSLKQVAKDSKEITEFERSLIKQTIVDYEKKLNKKVPDEEQFLDQVASVYRGNEELLQTQFLTIEERLDHHEKRREYCNKVKNTIEQIHIQNIFLLNEKDCKKAIILIKDLADIILRDLESLEYCLFIMEMVNAEIRSNDPTLSELKSEGVEPYIELANVQDKRLRNKIISKKMYKTRADLINSAIREYIQERANL